MNAACPLPDEPDDVARAGGPIEAGFRAAIDSAIAHLGATAPNPPVGCAILDRDGRLLVAAGHPRAGQPHAEAMALDRLAQAGRLAEAHTLLVTLEPCNHQGRTGPCTERILASPVRRVLIGCTDPNPHVRGHGEARLREAGIAVRRLDPSHPVEAALLERCAALIAPFARLNRDNRPWITIKQALDPRGAMVPPPGTRTFTGTAALDLAHALRRATDAVVTGTGTVLADRPLFTVRRLPDHAGRRPRVLAVLGRRAPPPDWTREVADRFTLCRLDRLDLLLPTLARAGVLWAMVEAGPVLLAALEAAGSWDDRLLIRQGADGADTVSVQRPPGRADPSPLILLHPARPRTKEDPCSLAS